MIRLQQIKSLVQKTMIFRVLFLFLARFFRTLVDCTSDIIFGLLFRGGRENLPPITDQCLLVPATALASKIRKQELKCLDVIKSYIKRIREVQPIVNAIVDERFAEAVEEAIRIDQLILSGVKSEEEWTLEKPLLGVPVTIKESIAVEGCLYSVGLIARKGHRAEFDADVVKLLKKAGAIPIAVTMTPELCYWWETYSILYGRSRNPYDTTRTVGGSSGGEGCILGCGASVIGIGNDIGGSIRIPAFFNGIFGHKPSRGIVSNKGEYPPAAPALNTYLMTGPMCRYAPDLVLLMKVLSGENRDKLRFEVPVDISKIKVYYMEDDGGNPLISSVSSDIKDAIHKVLLHFQVTYGVCAQKVELSLMKHSFEMWANILTSSDMQPVTVEMTGRQSEANICTEWLKWLCGISDHILPVLGSASLSKFMSKDQKKSARFYSMVSKLLQEFEDMLGNDGVFLYPTNPTSAPYHGQPLCRPFDVGYTAIFNLLGLPVSQCPLGLDPQGLPLGVQVVGGLYNDRLTIAVAQDLEKVFGGWVSPCPVTV